MDPRIRLRHLRFFLAVAHHGSVTRAAESLNTVQPSVSRTIAELEEIVGKPLFERSRRGLVPTAAGEALLEFVDSGLSQIAEGVSQCAGRGPAQVVSFGILPNVASALAPQAVEKFKQVDPQTTVRLHAGTADHMLPMLRSGEIDFIIGRLLEAERIHGLNFDHLYDERLTVACRSDHPLAGVVAPSLFDLDRYQVIVPLPGTIIRKELNRHLMTIGLGGFANALETVSFEFARGYAIRGDAVIILPYGALKIDIASGMLVELNVAGSQIVGPVGMTHVPGRKLSMQTRRLMNLFREVSESMPQA